MRFATSLLLGTFFSRSGFYTTASTRGSVERGFRLYPASAWSSCLFSTRCFLSVVKGEPEVAGSAVWGPEAHKHRSMARTPHARADG